MREVAGDAAMLVDPHDPDHIADRVIKILSSQDLMKSFMEKGLQRVEEFSLELFGKRHVELYSSL